MVFEMISFSSTFQASPLCLPSLDGNLVAILHPSQIDVWSVRALAVERILKLPPGLASGTAHFLWGPDSRHILVANTDRIQVLDVMSDDRTTDRVVHMPPGLLVKGASVQFGPTEAHLCVCSPHGTKLILVNLSTSKLVEVTNPKLCLSQSAARGYSFRPRTHQLAMMTRVSGKDMISIHDIVHDPEKIYRSWHSDTTDAQGVRWSPDGQWLVVWESPAYGHKVVIYTSDGYLLKIWTGPASLPSGGKHLDLSVGVKELQFSPSGSQLALADHGGSVYLLDMSTLSESMRLMHPATILPRDTLQIWQEQITMSQTGMISHAFVRGLQPILPSARGPGDRQAEAFAVCGLIRYDCSGTLLASRLDNSRSTIWIWDVVAGELRAVLLFHSEVSSLAWHPNVNEMLLVRCSGDESGAAFLWGPISSGPQTLELAGRLPGRKIVGRLQTQWLGLDSLPASLLLSDDKHCIFAYFSESAEDEPVWKTGDSHDKPSRGGLESPLELTPAPGVEDDILDATELDDTFHFKRIVT